MGSHYESSGGVITRYYLAGGTRVAMRKGSTFYWLLSDHLGSTSKVATSTGALHSQQLYKAWGESRYTSGTLPTRYTYTGQYSYASDFGLVELEEKDSIEYVRLSYTFLYRINDSMQ